MTNLAKNPGQGANRAATRDIVVEDVLPHPPEKVWKALTTAELIGRWLMPNDFEPVAGKRFTFTTQPEGTGTRLRMVHAGFRSPQNDFAYDAMSSGWQRIVGKINEIAAAL